MAVITYLEGDHPSGFIGCRVATTLHHRNSYKQMYFSATPSTIEAARIKAEAKNAEWRNEAKENKQLSLLDEQPTPAHIARCFRSIIRVSKEKLRNGTVIYTTPAFVVGSGNQKTFPIGGKYTLEEAFLLAVAEYCKRYQLDRDSEAELLLRQPDINLFTGYLYNNAVKNGQPVNMIELINKLSKVKN